MKFYLFFAFIAVFALANPADAAIKMKNHTQEKIMAESENADEAAMIATLENDIAILDAEIEKCQKAKKGWIAATVIGGVGVASTGIAAAVQGAQISEKKSDLSDKKETLQGLQREKAEVSK